MADAGDMSLHLVGIYRIEDRDRGRDLAVDADREETQHTRAFCLRVLASLAQFKRHLILKCGDEAFFAGRNAETHSAVLHSDLTGSGRALEAVAAPLKPHEAIKTVVLSQEFEYRLGRPRIVVLEY